MPISFQLLYVYCTPLFPMQGDITIYTPDSLRAPFCRGFPASSPACPSLPAPPPPPPPPRSVTPSQKYSARGARGEVVSTFGTVQGDQWRGQRARGPVGVELLEGPEESLVSSYKFMFQRLRDVRNGASLHPGLHPRPVPKPPSC